MVVVVNVVPRDERRGSIVDWNRVRERERERQKLCEVAKKKGTRDGYIYCPLYVSELGEPIGIASTYVPTYILTFQRLHL